MITYFGWTRNFVCVHQGDLARASRDVGWWLSSRRHRVLLAPTTLGLDWTSSHAKSYDGDGQLSGHISGNRYLLRVKSDEPIWSG
jgi:hypothetical protein